jgi:protein-tyrosine sulfotransferase
MTAWAVKAPLTLLLSTEGTIEAWSPSLGRAVALAPAHVSVLSAVAGGQSLSAALEGVDTGAEEGAALVRTLLDGGLLCRPGAASDDRPIFILGAPRSGTTLVRKILDSHPRIACGSESVFLSEFRELVIKGNITRQISSFGMSEVDLLGLIRGIAHQVHGSYAAGRGKARWADKTPAYTAIGDFIFELFGDNAVYVIIVRHGLDTALSMKQAVEDRFWGRTIGGFASGDMFSDEPLEAGARVWAHLNDRLYRFWQRRKREARFLVLKYEALVEAPKATIDQLFGFLNEETPEHFLETLFNQPLEQGEPRGGSGDYKIRQRTGIDASGVGRWRTLSSDWIGSLSDIVNPVATRWGYDALEK